MIKTTVCDYISTNSVVNLETWVKNGSWSKNVLFDIKRAAKKELQEQIFPFAVVILSLSYRLASPKTRIFPVILKNVFLLSFSEPRCIKLEERTNVFICSWFGLISPKIWSFQMTASPISPAWPFPLQSEGSFLMRQFMQKLFTGNGQTSLG